MMQYRLLYRKAVLCQGFAVTANGCLSSTANPLACIMPAVTVAVPAELPTVATVTHCEFQTVMGCPQGSYSGCYPVLLPGRLQGSSDWLICCMLL
jgi:hypothetical protein